MDSDDASDLILEVERSFDVWLGEDLSSVVTVGDLHALVVRSSGATTGEACGTSRAFHRMRTMPGAGRAGPDDALRQFWQGSPRQLRRLLKTQTGWDMPAITVSWYGCAGALLGAALALLLGWRFSGWFVVPCIVAGALCVRIDRGAWFGDWATLGTLARAVAARNHSVLVRDGARHSAQTVWHALVTLIADYGIDRAVITPAARLCA